MIRILSNEEMSPFETISLQTGTLDLAFRPQPQATGNLQVDPEIQLPSPGMDVNIASYYNAVSTNNSPFGYGWTSSVFLTAQASPTPSIVTMTRGNGYVVSYLESGSGTNVFNPQTPGLFNTLSKDVGNGLWKETTPDGFTFAYVDGHAKWMNIKTFLGLSPTSAEYAVGPCTFVTRPGAQAGFNVCPGSPSPTWTRPFPFWGLY